MTTTLRAITDEQIAALGADAANGGDLLQAAISARATDEPYDHMALSTAERARVDAMTMDEARAECARVIRDADAMAD